MTETDIELSFIIVNYNSIQLLVNLVESIRKTMDVVQSEILVIDNNSEDDSVQVIHKRFPEILLIQNQKNMGFGYACNQGIKASTGKYLFLLNSDTELLQDTLVNLRKYIIDSDNYKNVGIFGFRLLNPDGSLQYSMGRFPTLLSIIIDMFKPPVKRRVLSTGYDRIRHVDWVTGACMLINRKTIEDIGLFDENFFMYYEETDFCLRAKKAGWDVLFNPSITVIHKHPHALKKDTTPLRIRIEIRRSHLYYFRKNRTYISFVLLFAATMIILYLKAIKLRMIHSPEFNESNKLIRAVIDHFYKLK